MQFVNCKIPHVKLEQWKKHHEENKKSQQKKDEAKAELRSKTRPFFTQCEEYKVFWYYVAIHTNLLPQGEESFFKVSPTEQLKRISQQQFERQQKSLKKWLYFDKCPHNKHSCCFVSLFDDDSIFDNLRYNKFHFNVWSLGQLLCNTR